MNEKKSIAKKCMYSGLEVLFMVINITSLKTATNYLYFILYEKRQFEKKDTHFESEKNCISLQIYTCTSYTLIFCFCMIHNLWQFQCI